MALPLLKDRRGVLPMSENLDGLRLLTLPEAAELLHVSTRTLQRMIQRKDLPAFKVGGQWRVRESQLTRWIEGREGRPDVFHQRSGKI
jgi:excisionase family DNA binding protein